MNLVCGFLYARALADQRDYIAKFGVECSELPTGLVIHGRPVEEVSGLDME